MTKIFPEIFKRDSKGLLRVWQMEQEGERYRTISGLADGKKVTTEWTRAYPTNEGRANARDAVAQATFEIEAAYTKKLTREYHRTVEATSGGAHFFKPMLAKEFKGWAGPCWAQPKLDGIRCIATKDGLFSRQGKPITAVPHIHASLREAFLVDPNLILDGELYNHDLKDDFNEIVSIVRKKSPSAKELEKAEDAIQYHVYDMPQFTNGDKAGFDVRTQYVQRVAREVGFLSYVPTHYVNDQAELDQLYGQWLELGYEGQMVRLAGHYEQKRSSLLLKRKEFQDAEYEVISIEEGQGNWSGVAKRVVCRLPDGREFGAGIKGSYERAKTLLNETHKVATIRFFALTPDGVPRFPVATQFHGEGREL
jgi:DNA ligase 1